VPEPLRTLTEADVEAIAEALAAKLRPAKPEPPPKPKKRKTKAEIAAIVEMRLRRAGIR
jgi:hypothetical protein